MSYFIYVLKCPLSGDVRYVGKCTNLKSRLRQHISEAKIGKVRSHKCAWIASLLRRGLRPIIETDRMIAPGESWKEAEISRVAFYRAIGCDLTNATDGGDEPGELTDEGRKILSVRASAQFGTAEGRKRQSEIMKRLCADKDWVAQRAIKMKAAKATHEYKMRASERHKSQWRDSEFRDKTLSARKDGYANPEYRRLMSEISTKIQTDPKRRAQNAERARAAWKNPEIRARQIEAIRASRIK